MEKLGYIIVAFNKLPRGSLRPNSAMLLGLGLNLFSYQVHVIEMRECFHLCSCGFCVDNLVSNMKLMKYYKSKYWNNTLLPL